jgi:hypothetical protein
MRPNAVMGGNVSYSLEMDDDEVGVVVDALMIQREKWQAVVMKKTVDDPSVSHVSVEEAARRLTQHEDLLRRLRGLL